MTLVVPQLPTSRAALDDRMAYPRYALFKLINENLPPSSAGGLFSLTDAELSDRLWAALVEEGKAGGAPPVVPRIAPPEETMAVRHPAPPQDDDEAAAQGAGEIVPPPPPQVGAPSGEPAAPRRRGKSKPAEQPAEAVNGQAGPAVYALAPPNDELTALTRKVSTLIDELSKHTTETAVAGAHISGAINDLRKDLGMFERTMTRLTEGVQALRVEQEVHRKALNRLASIVAAASEMGGSCPAAQLFEHAEAKGYENYVAGLLAPPDGKLAT